MQQSALTRRRGATAELFADRFRAAAARFAELDRRFGPGWGTDPGHVKSIVNTAEVLLVLNAASVGYEDDLVHRGMGYIAEHAPAHWHTDVSDGRGPNSRYAIYGLLGLTAYELARHDPRYHSAQTACVDWLDAHRIDDHGCGWPAISIAREAQARLEEEHDPGHAEYLRELSSTPSILATSLAVQALDRLPPWHPSHQVASRLCSDAREHLVWRAQRRGRRQASWSRRPSSTQPHIAMTALAVLALADGTAKELEKAREGARWLHSHVEQWSRSAEPEADTPGAFWQHMSFSLGLRAVLAVGGVAKPSDTRLVPAIEYLDELWSERQGGFSHGEPGVKVTPTGAWAVAAAHTALAKAWGFDANRDILGRVRRVRRREGDAPARPLTAVELTHDRQLRVIDANNPDPVAISFGESEQSWKALTFLAARHVAGPDADEQSPSLEEIGAHLGSNFTTVRKLLERINQRVMEDAVGRGELLERIGDGRGPQARWSIAADRVSVEPMAD